MQWFEPKNDGRLIYRQDGMMTEKEVDQTFKFFLTRRKASYEQPHLHFKQLLMHCAN